MLGSTIVVAKDRTSVETFIMHVKESNKLVTVSDIWAADNNFDKTELLKNVAKAQPLTVDYARVARFMNEKSFAINLVIPGPDGTFYTIELAQHQVLANDFEVHTMGANGVDTRVDYTPGLYYRGVVQGVEGSLAAFSFFNNEIYGIFSIPEVGNFVVTPNTMVGKEYDHNQHYIVYNDADILFANNFSCEADKIPGNVPKRRANKTTTTLNNKVYNSCKQMKWFHVADYGMYQRKGSSVTNCTNYITSLVNNNAALYMNEGVPILSKYVQVNNASDAYATLPTTSSSTWLTKFGQTTMNVMHGCDLAMLLTTKGGSMGGVAWLDVICQPYGGAPQHAGPYGFCNIDNSTSTTTTPFPTYSWDVSATTHEMGHNLGSQHTHACAWGPTRTTAIDGCYTLEGSCANPGKPACATKGTIMSYCHLASGTSCSIIGINFTNGFGQQPGDTIRYAIAHTSPGCGELLKPNIGLQKAARTITANRECTDVTSGVTYYYANSNTLNTDNDTLVLMVRKNGNNIGNLNSTGFAVSATTLTGWGGGTAQSITFPTGTSGVGSTGNNYGARRFWTITHTGATVLPTAVEVWFPLTGSDTTDVNGSAPGATAPFNNFKLYSVKKPTISADPSGAFTGATAADIAVHTYSTTPSTTKWTRDVSGSSTLLAYFLTTTLHGGGAFYVNGSSTSDVGTLGTHNGISVYPNPTNSEWFFTLPDDMLVDANLMLYTAEGRIIHSQLLQPGTLNTVSGAKLPAGMYFYRVINGSNVSTGTLIKN
ncbi:hypothetical protein GCM10023093_00550 [Nemorincola caseinilytica]|uniref:Peptidase M12B domain-containing protein n=1 Tax=Nemorincola caseinilytica TaxID=2054315 RepID=A0ABP8N150_9BACT